MKRFLIMITCIFSLLLIGNVCYASENLGDAICTDIVTYINHVPIQSHNFNGKTLIVAEDLTNFGFDVKWNEYKRTLTITRSERNDITIPFVTCPSGDEIGMKEFTVTTTDVGVYTGNYKYSSYGGIDGYTLIDVNDLACIDNVKIVWVPEVRAVKIWVEDGLEMSDYMLRPIPSSFGYYDDYLAPDYSYNWSWEDNESYFSIDFCMKTVSGDYVNTDYGKLTITNVIDADGNSILKEPVSTEGTSVMPYIFDLSDNIMSLYLYLTPDDLYPKTATENGGIIKFSYKQYGYTDTVSDSIRVEQLPYGIIEPVNIHRLPRRQ